MVYCVKNTLFPSNTYLLCSKEDNRCLIIDPGLNEKLIDEKIVGLGKIPIGIIATHGHFDHIGSVNYFKVKYNIPFYIHEKDFRVSQSANFFLKISRINHKIITTNPDILIKEKNEILLIGDFKIKVYNYPGHSDGSIIIEYQKLLFTGDLFFKKGLGFNGFPGENKVILRKSIIDIFDSFSDDYRVYPGHGESETIGFIKKQNSDLIDFLHLNTIANE